MDFLEKLGIKSENFGACSGHGGWIENTKTKKVVSLNPTNGKNIASVYESSIEDYEKIVLKSKDAYEEWKTVPAPVRGQLVRQLVEDEPMGPVCEKRHERRHPPRAI